MSKLIIPEKYVNDGLITKRKHPKYDIWIYNYTPKVQYDKLWDDITLQCRGLVLDSEYNIIARPFKKFFNLGEANITIDNLPKGPYVIIEKMDGSLFLVFKYKNEIVYASRGSFESEQALKGRWLCENKFDWILPKIQNNNTYIFEVIYPENETQVVDYGTLETIVGLGIIHNDVNRCYVFTDDWQIPTPAFIEKELSEILEDKNSEWKNKEGFVIWWPVTNERVKIKYDSFTRLHRLKSNLTEKHIWEILSAGEELPDLTNIPDEMFKWIQERVLYFKNEFRKINGQAQIDLQYIRQRPCIFKNQKIIAKYINAGCKYPAVTFMVAKNKNPSKLIWKMLKP